MPSRCCPRGYSVFRVVRTNLGNEAMPAAGRRAEFCNHYRRIDAQNSFTRFSQRHRGSTETQRIAFSLLASEKHPRAKLKEIIAVPRLQRICATTLCGSVETSVSLWEPSEVISLGCDPNLLRASLAPRLWQPRSPTPP